MPIHIVEQGECLSSIAFQHGFPDYQALYEHPSNDALRRKRPDPHILMPGDRVVIPERKAKQIECVTGRTHEITVRRPKRLLRLNLKDEAGKALGGTDYTLEIDGTRRSGTTTHDGVLSEEVPASAAMGVVTLTRYRVHFRIAIGYLDPVEDPGGEPIITGIQARLNNLGFGCGDVDGELGPRTRAALKQFQQTALMRDAPDGEPDQETRNALREKHGC